jgi:4-amino-4-deoxy-L-arabinose transferase-like glycosyltransferase
MHAFFQHRAGHYLFLTAAASLLFFANLGGATLWDLDEGRNATCAVEMMASGDWIVPTFNGELRDHKPVLLYWLQIVCYQVGGVSEGMARLPSALAALLTLFVAYELGRGMFSKSTGLLGGLAAATSPMLIGAARFANPDALLNLFTALTLLLFWINVQRPRVTTFLLLGASAGLAVLAKGPVGLLLPGAIGVVFLVWERRWTPMFDRRLLWATLSFLLVAAPWYVLVGVITHGQFLTSFLSTHNLGRFTSTMENHGGSIFYYPIAILAGSMPWSLFAAGAVWAAIWSCVRTPVSRWQPSWDKAADQSGRGGAAAYRFLSAWILVYLVFFSISATKLPNYVLPVIVPWTLLSARFLDRWRKETLALPAWYLTSAAFGLALVGVGFGVGLAIAAGVGEMSFMRNRFLPGLLPFAAIGVVPIAASSVMVFSLRTGRRALFVRSILGAALLLLAPLAAWATAALNGVKAPASLAWTPAGRIDIDQRVVALDMGRLPSLNFYLRRDVTHVARLSDVATHLKMPLPTFAIVPEDCVAEFQRLHPGLATELSRHAEMYRGTKIVLLANTLAAGQHFAALK